MKPGLDEATCIEADIDLSEEDYVRAYTQHGAKNTKTNRRTLAILLIVAGVAVYLAWPVTFGVWTLMLPLLAVTWIVMPRQARGDAERAFAATPDAWKHVRLTLDDEHVTVSSEKLHSYRPWSQITGWKETEDFVLLLSGTAISDIFPKAAFDDLPAVRALLDDRIVVRRTGAPRVPAGAAQRKDRGRWKLVVAGLFWCALIALYALWSTST